MAEPNEDNKPRVVVGGLKKRVSKKTKLIMLIIIVLLIAGGLGWYKLKNHNSSQTPPNKLTFPDPKPTSLFQVKRPKDQPPQ